VHRISTFVATPSQCALQYLALAGGTQLQAAFAHFFGVGVAIGSPPLNTGAELGIPRTVHSEIRHEHSPTRILLSNPLNPAPDFPATCHLSPETCHRLSLLSSHSTKVSTTLIAMDVPSGKNTCTCLPFQAKSRAAAPAAIPSARQAPAPLPTPPAATPIPPAFCPDEPSAASLFPRSLLFRLEYKDGQSREPAAQASVFPTAPGARIAHRRPRSRHLLRPGRSL